MKNSVTAQAESLGVILDLSLPVPITSNLSAKSIATPPKYRGPYFSGNKTILFLPFQFA